MEREKVLFICTHNSARSQMAEGLINHLHGDRFQGYSAGTEATRVNPFAIRAMEELGIDITGHRSKIIEEFRGERFDFVVTVCDNARESCPIFPGETVLHQSFPDPSAASGSDEQILQAFREARDSIREWIERELVQRVS
jgi:arsenate reductase